MEIEEIHKLYSEVRNDKRRQWNRTLPFDEMVFDRWELAEYLGFGKGSSIYHNTYVFGQVLVGENTWIGPGCLLDGSGSPLKIGASCSISSGVQIYTHDSIAWALTGGQAAKRQAPVIIGDACHIGAMAVITKGVHIEGHCLVGANSVVTADIPAYSIARGNPAETVGRIHVEGPEIKLEFFK